MASGGPRRNSGPAPSPTSATSDRKGLKFTTLPSEGFSGDVPPFPLPKMLRYRWEFEDKRRYQVLDLDLTQAFREAEESFWEWAWRTPQAALWATPQWSWVLPSVADWCRLKALSCEHDAAVGIWAAIRQREGDILLTSEALGRAGYTIATDALAEKRAEASEKRPSSRTRLTAVSGGGR